MTVRPESSRTLISVAEALAFVRAEARPLPPIRLGLLDAQGTRLAEDVAADIDLPPFDKALVDGFAVRSADVAGDSARLTVIEEIHAGEMPRFPLGPGQATAIMTGAPLPDGADAVVMVEKTTRPDGATVIVPGPVAAGQNRLVRGREMRRGEVVVRAGSVLDAATSGVLASVGATMPLLQQRPTVWVVATGDELVETEEIPGPGQIRNSNTVMLAALVEEHGGWAESWPIVPDRPEKLASTFRDLLKSGDVLLVSGGVSAGKRDLVPEAFEAAGARNVFHKVRVKPGKPIWFGVGPDREEGPPTLVFGLPGNPVSGLVGFLLFVRPALAILAGRGDSEPTMIYPLLDDYRHDDDRDVYRPSRLVSIDGLSRIDPLPSAGSSDLRAAASADGFAIFPAGERMYQRGEPVGFLPIGPSRFAVRTSYS